MMHNLSTVFWFEVVRTLKKKSFWLAALGFPVMIGVVGGIIYFSNKATSDAYEQAASERFEVAISDPAEYISPGLIEAYSVDIIDNKQSGIEDVKSGMRDAYIYYPSDLTKQNVEVYARDVGIFDNGRYNALAELLLKQSVASTVEAGDAAVLAGGVNYNSKTYRDGAEHNPVSHMIAPGFFLVLFYFLIAMFANQMLTSTTEEKENRVIEMLLTTVRAKTLIVGKILSLIVLALVQAILVTTPPLVAYLLYADQLSLPVIDLSSIVFDPVRILIAVLVFGVGFMLFTGLLVAISSAVPTAKEANSFFGVVMILIFGPLYAAPVFVSSPDAMIVQALSYFPFTAPIPLMLRNAVGNLELWQAALSLGIMLITTIIVLNIAVKVFRSGVIEYSRKLSLREIFAPQK